MDFCGPKFNSISYWDAAALETLFVFTLNRVGTSADVFKKLFCKNSLLNIQKYTVPEAKRQGNNRFEFHI